MVQVVIVAGGYGTRMKRFLDGKPKSLIDLKGISFVEMQLLWLDKKASSIHFCLGHLASGIVRQIICSNNFNKNNITYKIENEPLGVIGAVSNSSSYLDNYFCILLGDILPNVCFSYLLDLAKKDIESNKSVMFIAPSKEVEGQKGNVNLDNDSIIYSKNPDFFGSHVDIGFWILQKEHVTELSDLKNEEEFFNNLISKNYLSVKSVKENSWEVGSKEGLDNLLMHIEQEGEKNV